MRLSATISTANIRTGWIWWSHVASPDTGGARVETCWVVGAADEVEEVGLPEVVMVVEVVMCICVAMIKCGLCSTSNIKDILRLGEVVMVLLTIVLETMVKTNLLKSHLVL